MDEIVVFGAGAIGRGFLPWVINMQKHPLVFVDSDACLVNQMKRTSEFRTYRVQNGNMFELSVRIAGAYVPEDFSPESFPNMAACFFSVGPRNVAQAASSMRYSRTPLVLCENDPNTVRITKDIVGHSNVFFAVPDVITSNTAPTNLLERDPLSVVTEDGKLFMESGVEGLSGDFQCVSTKQLLQEHWPAKLYLHNTPHCIAAYLGALQNLTYIHEALAVDWIDEIVTGAMCEMLTCLKKMQPDLAIFFDCYAEKELARFRNRYLYDPILRVAREPLRKLDKEERLIGAAQICLAQGVPCTNILLGIVSAVMFDRESDTDNQLPFLRRAIPAPFFQRYILGMRNGEPLDRLLASELEDKSRYLLSKRNITP